MLCPTTPDGKTQDCTKAPRVVNNSWGGGQGSTNFSAAIDALKAAGIIPVFTAGNNGLSCSTVNSPGDLPSVIAVGATDCNDALASFSSKSPSVNGVMKPDVSVLGALIRSSCYADDKSYCTMSGTSMATPHMTGTNALYLSAKPTATYEQAKQYLQSSAATSMLGKTGYAYSNTADGVSPNNQYGYGHIDASKVLA
jgi:subtilisin family serine protease